MNLELRVERDGEIVRLLAPDVGLYTCALPRGAAVAPGQRVGVLHRLGREVELIVPAGVAGVVTSDRPPRVLEPVGFGAVLAEVSPMDAAAQVTSAEELEDGAGLVLRAQNSGRFYHRPAPGEPAFVEAGDRLEQGAVVGLIEVMKTFTHVTYGGQAGLPERSRLVRMLAADGADVVAGEALIEVEED